MTGLCDAAGVSQPVNVFYQYAAIAISQRYDEEGRATRDENALLTGHVSPPESRPAAIRDEHFFSPPSPHQGKVGKAKRAHAERMRITDRYWPRVVRTRVGTA